MLWAIYCTDKTDTAALRDQHMRPHREYLDQRRSVLLRGGNAATLLRECCQPHIEIKDQ